MKKAYFQYYETFEKIVKKFETAEEREHFREALINYGFYGIEPEELSEKEALVWDIVQDLIDDQVHRREINRANREARKAQKQTYKPVEPVPEEPAEVAETEQQEKQEEPAANKKFAKPTVEEVQSYCDERKNGINAQAFVDYYEAKGWKVGNTPMKNWKAAVRTWEQRRTQEPAKKELPDDKLVF